MMNSLQVLSPTLCSVEVPLGDYTVRGALICGPERTVIWDTLSHPNDMKRFLPQLGDRKLTIIYSHADWDHVWGTAGLPYQHAEIIAHEHCLKRFSTDVPVTLAEKNAAESNTWRAVELIPPTTTFRQEYSLDLGAERLTLHQLPGHTPDSIVGFLPEQGILLMGDAVETPLPLISERRLLPAWIAELQRWANDSRVRKVIPSHGPVGGPEILKQNIAYLERLWEGKELAFPKKLPGFYRESHEENLYICRTQNEVITGEQGKI